MNSLKGNKLAEAGKRAPSLPPPPTYAAVAAAAAGIAVKAGRTSKAKAGGTSKRASAAATAAAGDPGALDADAAGPSHDAHHDAGPSHDGAEISGVEISRYMFGEMTGTNRSTTAPTTAPPRKKRKREPNDYRDSAFYMAHERPVDKGALAAAASDEYLRVHAGERKLDEAVLDLVEDERDGLKKRRSVLKWDQKKRKYVREVLGQTGVGAAVGVADRGKKRLRDESGQLVKERANL